MRRRRSLRALLTALTAATAAVGAYAAVDPRGFYRHVLGVDLLGPYNEHLLRDVGGLYIGFAIVFGWATVTLALPLIRAACAGFAITQALHLAYHASHLARFTTGQAVAQSAGLGALLVLPVIALAIARGHGERESGRMGYQVPRTPSEARPK